MEALRIYEEDIADYVGRGGLGEQIGVRVEFFDEDFFSAVENHRARLAKLKELGIEGNYFKLIQAFNVAVLDKVLKLARDPKLEAVEITVSYDKETLRDAVIDVAPASIKGHESQVVASERGLQTVIVRIPDGRHQIDGGTGEVDLKEHLWRLRRPFQRALDKVYLGEELANW
jgi:hypothetical protein